MASIKGKKGVDVSTWQGLIDWAKAKTVIDFAIIRAGFGKNTLDNQALNNIKGCQTNKIPFGLYWFSYALSESDAVNEANYCCDMADKYKITLPIVAYDWEGDSEDYYFKQKGTKITNNLRYKFALAFLNRVKERGYTPVIYANYDDMDRGYKPLVDKFDVWMACPGSSKPSINNLCLWQYSWTGKVAGINGDVDMNTCYKDYTSTESSGSTPSKPSTPTVEKPSAAKEKTTTLTVNYLGIDYKNPTGQVRTVQRILNTCNYKGKDGNKLAEDGVFGVNTEYAVISYQKKHSLTADGVIGPVTWKALTGAK